MHLRYAGEFTSLHNHVVRCEIWQRAEEPFAEVGDLTFEADETLNIEWEEVEKHEPIVGSEATMSIESPTDRKYIDLYTEVLGEYRLDVYRDGQLYWQGILDTEFYEEPYERARNYPVSLAFSDLGKLDRIPFDLTGLVSLEDILRTAFDKVGYTLPVDQSLISTSIAGKTQPLQLADIKVMAANFYDEDGEPKSYREVIAGVLQPLGLRIEQRAGKFYVYDLNGLYNADTEHPAVWWSSDSQTLGTDIVYNDAVITFSAYEQGTGIFTDKVWDDARWPLNNTVAYLNMYNFNDPTHIGEDDWLGVTGNTYCYNNSVRAWVHDPTAAGFTIWGAHESKKDSITYRHPKTRIFKIVPQLNDEECEGVALNWWSLQCEQDAAQNYSIKAVENGLRFTDIFSLYPYKVGEPGVDYPEFADYTVSDHAPLFITEKKTLAPIAHPSFGSEVYLHIKMDILVDPRFNPFIESGNFFKGSYRQKDNEDFWNLYGHYVYVPVRIVFTSAADGQRYVWTNRALLDLPRGIFETDNGDLAFRDSAHPRAMSEMLGEWVKDTGEEVGYLLYYSKEIFNREEFDKDSKSGVLGWQTNKQAIPLWNRAPLADVIEADPGQRIPYPEFGPGEIQIEVCKGWGIRDYSKLNLGSIFNPGQYWIKNTDPSEGYTWRSIFNFLGIYVRYPNPTSWVKRDGDTEVPETAKAMWVLCKKPIVDVVKAYHYEEEMDGNDIEYRAVINENAKEDVELTLICGTSTAQSVASRAVYIDSLTGKPIPGFTRAGQTEPAEVLLINTLFSQHGQRRTMLSGEMAIPDNAALTTFTEDNQPGALFMRKSDVQHLRLDTADTKIIELRPDEYEPEVTVKEK